MNTSFKIILTAATSFAGGYLIGLLTTPKSGRENREWISNNAGEARHWIEEKGHAFKEESERKIDEVTSTIKKSVKDSIPDLYEATEEISLNDEEVKNG